MPGGMSRAGLYTGSMLISGDVLRLHLDYSAWASERLLQAAGSLSADELHRDFGPADKSIAGPLAHIYGGDRVWLARLRGDPPERLPGPEYHDLPVLAAAWRATTRG